MVNEFKMFKNGNAKKLYVQLSDGRMMLLADIVMDYERLLKEEHSKKDEPSQKAITSQLKVGEWFRIDRDVIAKNREKIHHVCNEAGKVGKVYWKRFEESNKIADENPNQYPRIIETYIFMHNWEYKTELEMWDMCEKIGKGMCDEIICDLELQMRICNGESATDLFKKADKLPYERVIKLRNGGTGTFGSGANNLYNTPPAGIDKYGFNPNRKHHKDVPYAFR